MPKSAVPGEILARSHHAPDALAFFAAASAQLRRVIPHDAAVWRATDPDTGLMTAPVRAEHTDERGCWDYWECEFLAERVNLFSDLAQAVVPVAALWESTGGEPEHAAIYGQFMRPRGLHDELRAVLRAGGRPQGHFSLFRARGSAPFTPAETRFVAGLTAPLGRRLRTYAEPAPRPPSSDTPGLLLFDSTGRLVSATDEARRHLAALHAGPTSASALGLPVPSWLHALVIKTRVGAARGGDGSAADGATGRVTGGAATEPRVRLRTRTGQWLSCHAASLRDAAGGSGGTAVVIEPAKASEIVPLLAAAYELTDRELQITQLIARGLATDRIAADLFLSPHTVRDHIKAVFDKTGVSTRGALVGKLFIEQYEPRSRPGIVRVAD